MTDSPAFYEERLRLLQAENQEAQEMLAAEQHNGNDLLAENQQLRDALADILVEASAYHGGPNRKQNALASIVVKARKILHALPITARNNT